MDKIFVMIDRAKLLQILINLIQNAKEAVLEKKNSLQPKINISLQKHETYFSIIVADNGIGIPSENIHKIFSFGFTTKKNGHGFGLHTSAVTAIEMGGKLTVESNGINLGSKFILTLPLKTEEKKSYDS